MTDERDKPEKADDAAGTPDAQPAAESIELRPSLAPPEPEPPMPRRPMMGIVHDAPADEAAKKAKAKPRKPFDPGYGGGTGFLFVVLAIAGMMAMTMTVRVERPAAANADAMTDAPADQRPATTPETDEQKRAREDEALLRPPPTQEKRKPGTFFGIPTE